MAALTPGLICELALKAVLTAEKDVAWERSVRVVRGVIILVQRRALNRICRTMRQPARHTVRAYERDCLESRKRHIIAMIRHANFNAGKMLSVPFNHQNRLKGLESGFNETQCDWLKEVPVQRELIKEEDKLCCELIILGCHQRLLLAIQK
ncbi:MAG: hypothetical protein QM578_17255 [Pantoea sp.]|uniref:hypothetical protein n=1 Tax=Pantoea sp. TaxID=69393 RepID=UPI0039E411FF